jgi:phospholipid N-methyltransferase
MTGSVPPADAMRAALMSVVPFAPDESPRIVELGAGDGGLTDRLLRAFPLSSVTALESADGARADATRRLAHFGARARVAPFEIAGLDWWDALFGVDLVVSAFAFNRLNDAKKQYAYKAVADRLSERGALLIADRAQTAGADAAPAGGAGPSFLFHHLVWLRHAGFGYVDCWWASGGYAVFGGYKTARPTVRR